MTGKEFLKMLLKKFLKNIIDELSNRPLVIQYQNNIIKGRNSRPLTIGGNRKISTSFIFNDFIEFNELTCHEHFLIINYK